MACLSSSKLKFLHEGFGMMKSPTPSEFVFRPIFFLRAFFDKPCAAPPPRREIVEIFHTLFDVFFTCPTIFFHCSSPAIKDLSSMAAVRQLLDTSASRTPLGEGSSLSLSSCFEGETEAKAASGSPFFDLPFLDEDSVPRLLLLLFLCFFRALSLSAQVLMHPMF